MTRPATAATGTTPAAASTATARARSNAEPRLGSHAGLSPSVMRRCGHASPELTTAARTRSRASAERGVGQPGDREPGQPQRQVGLDLHHVPVDPDQRHRVGPRHRHATTSGRDPAAVRPARGGPDAGLGTTGRAGDDGGGAAGCVPCRTPPRSCRASPCCPSAPRGPSTRSATAAGRSSARGEEPDALVWTAPGGWDGLPDALAQAPGARWVQLPFAGVEGVAATGVITPDRTWTCAKGVYAEPVAEHALALALAGLRDLAGRARATGWGEQSAATLYDAPVVVLGAGGITEALLALLAPFRARVTAVRRDAADAVPGAERTVAVRDLDEVLPGARVVVLALALTAETDHLLDARRLRLPGPQAVLVNVARGRHVDTDALVEVLRAGELGRAALDVTDPEPLPDGHPLWSEPRALITPHTANPWATAQPLLARRVADNVGRFARGERLAGLVDPAAGY